MSVEIQVLQTSGELNYIAKHNANYTALKSAVEGLQSQMSGVGASQQIAIDTLFRTLFGPSPAIIGTADLVTNGPNQLSARAMNGGSSNPGFVWLPTLGLVIEVTDNPVGLTPNVTNYISFDAMGIPYASTEQMADAIWSVACGATEPNMATKVQIAGNGWSYPTWKAAQQSATLGVFATLDARLEAIETGYQRLTAKGQANGYASLDGTGKVPVAQLPGTAGGEVKYDFTLWARGKPSDGEVLLNVILVRDVTLPDDMVGSLAKAGVSATAEAVLTVKVNGATVGTITFAAGGVNGVFATSGAEVDLTAGDLLSVSAQGVADATLADISVTLKGTTT